MGYFSIHPRTYQKRANVKKGGISKSKILFTIEKGNKINRQIEFEIKNSVSHNLLLVKQYETRKN